MKPTALRSRRGSTPDRLRLLAIVTSVIAIAAGIVGWVLADRLVDDTSLIAESTGEVLIVNQQVNASYAEAHAAAVSVHLAGAEGDREQRRLYETAIERAAVGIERVARSVGDDEPSHEALERIAARTTRYVVLVEGARSGAVSGDAGADALLAQATDITRNDITPDVRLVTERFQQRLADQTTSTWFLVAFFGFAVLLVILLIGQVWLRRRFRRLINLPLLAATIITIVWLVFTGWSYWQQQQALDVADDQAYRSIRISEEIQQTAYEYRATETSLVLAGNGDSARLDALAAQLETSGNLLNNARSVADNAREQAAIDEVSVRWNRYREQSEAVNAALASGDRAEAARLTRGPANAAFNGFNTSVEAALLDNREQFFENVARATDSLRWMRWAVLIASAAAALLAWSGYALRSREYQ